MLRRQALTAMSGVFSQCLYPGGSNEAAREMRFAQLMAVSCGILWAVTIGLTVLNGP